MKRLSFLFACIILVAALYTPAPAFAATPVYARAAVRDAYFFADKNTSGAIFAVPYTYCIEVLGEDGDWYRARYAADSGVYRSVTGYCKKEDFTAVEGVPQVTYLYKTVTVTYTAKLPAGTLPVLNEIAIEAAYYGTYYSGATVYSYVYCQGSFGYIEGANDDYPLNEEEKKDEDPAAGEEPKKESGGWSAGLITVVIILALFVAVIVMLHFATARSAKKDG